MRLTPAYSVRLVRDRVRHLPEDAIITDPFSGTGTTPLAAVEHAAKGQALDVNPFLIWLGTVKTNHYERRQTDETAAQVAELTAEARRLLPDEEAWQPNLHNIERWWSHGALRALKALRRRLDECELPHESRDLLDIVFCRTAIATSSAAFNHQSMSFKATVEKDRLLDIEESDVIFAKFQTEATTILEHAHIDLPGDAELFLGDSRRMDVAGLQPCDLLLTSPPYANRMSYIRELRPYMYWLRYLDTAQDAAALDWEAIGGTWGYATSNLLRWEPGREVTPVEEEMTSIRHLIERDGGKSGALLGNYVAKYFHDMWAHLQAAFKHVKSGGRATYIIGNSTFYGHVVPTERWYAVMLQEAGFVDITVTTIRKRNSKKELFEFDVSGMKP